MGLLRFKSTLASRFLRVFTCAALCAVVGGATTVLATASIDQLGSDIDGEAEGDNFGVRMSLSSDGTRLAVGAYNNDGAADGAGHVRVLEFSGGSWSQLGDDIEGEAASDGFGQSVSLSSDGTIVAASALSNDGNGASAGHARVFELSGGSWSQLGDDIDGEAESDFLGYSISLSSDGTKLAVGAHGNDEASNNAGHVRVFEFSGGSWSQLGDDIYGEAENDGSGKAVSLSSDGTKLAIGAVGNDGNGSSSGHVRVFEFSGGSWTQLGDDIDGEVADDGFGENVSLSSDGTILAASAPYNDGAGNNAGRVRVFEFSGGTWVQVGSGIDGAAENNRLGASLSLSSDGTILAAGANGADETGTNAGRVRVYRLVAGEWTQLGDNIEGEAAFDAWGVSVSLSSDGSILAAGSLSNDGNGSSAGHARVYSITLTTLNITYDSQGGSAVSDGDATTTSGGSISVLPADPTREGYTFAGWFTAASDGTQITAGTAHNQTADFTLYAQWTENPVTTTTEVPVTTTTEVAATTTTDVPSTQLLPATGSRDTSEFLTLATVSGLLGAGVALIVIIRRRVHPA